MRRLAGSRCVACLLSGAVLACSVSQGPVGAPMPAADTAAVPSSSTTSDRCFGDSPPEAIAQDPRPRDLFATGKEVLWKSGALFHRVDAATGQVSTLPGGPLFFVQAADEQAIFGANHVLDLVAIDLPSGTSRVVSPSSGWPRGSATRTLPGVVTLFMARYALDSDYVYVAWHPDPAMYNYFSQSGHVRTVKGSHDLGDLARVKRDGSSPPEYLGRGPEARFLVADGYAYWASRYEGLKRRALTPGVDSEVVWAAPDVPFIWPIGLSGGRIYFSVMATPGPPRTYSIESVPLAPQAADGGSMQPRVHVASTTEPFAEGILDGTCVYSGGTTGVTRANIADGTVKPLIEGHPVPGDATVLGSQFLATDGRYLYWADNGGDRVVRWHR